MSILLYMHLITVCIAILLAATLGIKSAILFVVLYLVIYKLPVIYYLIGNYKYTSGQRATANKYFEKALRYPHLPIKHRITCVYIMLLQGEFDKAEQLITSLSKRKLQDADMLNLKINHSVLLWKRNRLDDSIEMLTSLIEKYKTTIIYQNLGFFLLLKGEYEKALQLNIEASEYDAANAGIMDNLAQSYYFMNENDKAIEIFEKLMQKNPTFPSAYYSYALALEKRNQIEDAVKMLKKGLECKFSAISSILKEELQAELDRLEGK